MTLKVIRYKNYGCQMTSEDDKDKFYFSFFELNNGEIRNYKFGNAKANDEYGMSEEFFKWFDSYPPGVDVIDSFVLYDEEEKCVKDFYLKHIEPIKHIKTDTTEV